MFPSNLKTGAKTLGALLTLGIAVAADAGDVGADPRPIPLTRPEMKEFLENMKGRKPRIPLPPITDEEKTALGERGANYEGRLRYHYMPGGTTPRGGGAQASPQSFFGFSREPDPKATLDYGFKTQLFWIVSRTNNCQYCLGHQESKLLSAGLTEDSIAALDGDWLGFLPSQQAAFAFARKYTYAPHELGDADIEALRKHFKDLQIIEMILSMAGNNAINRWKEGLGVPQSPDGGNFGRRQRGDNKDAPKPAVPEHQTYLTPTSDKYKTLVTKVAPIVADPKTGEPTKVTVDRRRPLESRAEVEQALANARQRKPRLPLASEDEVREILSADTPPAPIPQWIRLLAHFPRDGKSRILAIQQASEKGDLKPELKAKVAWVVARQDRAWYALAQAQNQLRALGLNDDQIFALDNEASLSDEDRVQLVVAKKLAASPVVLTDADVSAALEKVGPRNVVQLVNYITTRAAINRITEAAGLTAEGK